MSKLRLLAAAAVSATLSGAPDAAWSRDAAYCAYGGGRNNYEDCSYHSLRQCLDTVSGLGGACRPNPYYRYGLPPAGRYDEPPPRRRVVRPY